MEMSQLKVLFVSSGNNNNGLNPLINLQANSLKDEAIEISHFLIFGRGMTGYLKSIFKLRRFLSEHQFDLIHAHFGYCGIASHFGRKHQKLIVSLMGDDVLGAKDADGAIGFKNRLLVKINLFFSKYFYDHTIFKSGEMYARSSYRGKAYSIIPNGVDLKLFHAMDKKTALQKLKWSENLQHLIFVTNPSRPEKNFQLAENSYRELRESGFSVALHVVHNEPSEVLKYYYSAADVLLLSSFHEGSPNVIKEAMACNCPIVSTDVGDVGWVTSNVAGCYISTFGVNDFAEKIKLALNFSKKMRRTEGSLKIKDLGLDSDTISLKIKQVYQNSIRL